MRRLSIALVLACLGLGAGRARGGPPESVKRPSARAIDEAIRRGAAWLERQWAAGFDATAVTATPEIVLLTFVHARVGPRRPVYRTALAAALGSKLRHTYRVATLAMALSRIDPYRYRARLAHCAQWLVDTQLADGAWGYPGARPGTRETGVSPDVAPPVTKAEAAADGGRAPIVLKRRGDPKRPPPGKGDFSNTQFALLGLRACEEARVVVPRETWAQALRYQLSFQQRDGSWGYVKGGVQDEVGYASLTAAGIAGVVICRHGLGAANPRGHPAVKKGLAWLAKHWDPARNAGVERSAIIGPSGWQYYHLYAVERAGRILNRKRLGKRDWYAEGARWILANQKADGSFEDPDARSDKRYLRTADTCFAILFLSLSTPPLTGR